MFQYEGSMDCAKNTTASDDIKTEIFKGQCDVWALENTKLGRNNTYTFFAQKDK